MEAGHDNAFCASTLVADEAIFSGGPRSTPDTLEISIGVHVELALVLREDGLVFGRQSEAKWLEVSLPKNV